MCSTSTPGYAPTMSLTTRFPLLQRAGWSRAGSSAGGAGGTNQLYVFILRGGGIILESLAYWDIIRPMLISGTAFLRLRTNR